MEILILLAVGFAFRSAVDHLKATRKASEGARLKEAAKAFGGTLPKHKAKAAAARHSAGWWLREAGNGFPVTRTGWHAGWIAHRTEYLQHAGHREEAKTRHAEAQATAAETVHDHAQRRAAAKARRDAILQRLEDNPPEAKGRKAVQDAADATVLPFAPRQRPHATLPADSVGKPGLGPYATRRADGRPETDADKRFFDLRESGYDGPIDQDGYAADQEPFPDAARNPSGPSGSGPVRPEVTRAGTIEARDGQVRLRDWEFAVDQDQAAALRNSAGPEQDGPGLRLDDGDLASDGSGALMGYSLAELHEMSHGKNCDCEISRIPTSPDEVQPAPPSPATEGAPVSDTTFTSVVSDARAALARSDQDTAEIRTRKDEAYATADAMAAAGADPAVISAQMDYADQLAVAEKALAAAGEHAGATATSAEKYHGQMQEAHDSAPGKIATREFHGGS